jgi:diguanylate cyclase (GGDEF)-like protein
LAGQQGMQAGPPDPALSETAVPRPAAADPGQDLRLQRHLVAAGTSALVVLALVAFHVLGLIDAEVVTKGALAIVVLSLGFYLAFRSGLNRVARDPSLTVPQMVCAILVLGWLMYYAEPIRGALCLFYLVAMLFGVLRLDTASMVGLALTALVSHAAMLYLWHVANPGLDAGADIARLAVLGIVLPWFAVMGGYVNRMRKRLTDSNRRLVRAMERIEQVAIRDELTGAYNRRFLLEVLERECRRSRRVGSRLAVCLVDIDHFKSVNDSHGHAAGDAVLTYFSGLVHGIIRGADVFGRYGGEEFVIVLPDTDLQGAVDCAERIRRASVEADYPQIPVERRITATIGVALQGNHETPAELLVRADRALYQGKAAGRNCVMVG